MFKVTARTVLELGKELISSDIIAFYELVKNGFDARTKTGVEIRFSMVLRRNTYLELRARAAAPNCDAVALGAKTLESLQPNAPRALHAAAQRLLKQSSSSSRLVAALDSVYGLNSIVVSDTGSGMSREELVDNFLVIGTPSRKREVDAALARGVSKTPFLGEKGIGRLSAMRLGDRLRVETARRDDSNVNVLEIDWTEFESLDAMLEDIEVAPSEGDPKEARTWSGTIAW